MNTKYIKYIIVTLMLALAIPITGCLHADAQRRNNDQIETPTTKRFEIKYLGDSHNDFVYTDTKTGCEYLVIFYKGVTSIQLTDADGKPLIAEGYEKE